MLIDLGSMCGTFIKVSNTDPIELKQGFVFLVGNDINIEIYKIVTDSLFNNDSDFVLDEYSHTIQDSSFNGPYIIIKISKTFNDTEATMHTSSWRIFADGKSKVFTIGRSQLCHINLTENTISRIQCRVLYNKGKWVLLDGIENKPTVNGTWLSIHKKNTLIRQNSEPYPLKKGSQIKVSETVLQIDWD
jgi:FHA domain